MQRYRAKASRSNSQVSIAWASSTRVLAHGASEGNNASVPARSPPGGTSVVHRCRISLDGTGAPSRKRFPRVRPCSPGLMRRATAGPGVERAVGMHVVVERAGGEVAELAADLRD